MSDTVNAVGIIPARLGSTRFPSKVIASLLGKPLVQYIWESAKRSQELQRVIVAVDNPKVAEIVEDFGGEAMMTPSELPSGSDRVAHLAKDLDAQIIVNLQADEPLLSSSSIDSLVRLIKDHSSIGMATLAIKKQDPALLQDPNTVKCVCGADQKALYFSRKPLESFPEGGFLKHVGIYAYRKDILLKLSKLPPSPLETIEKLEQLRALENGVSIGVALIEEETYSVDVPEDLKKVESVLRRKQGMVV
jgi:3-deoxy-manno-octulosonate cytidylyltransferase (CMP-KDO synthetase)